jgi:hypothetical protein
MKTVEQATSVRRRTERCVHVIPLGQMDAGREQAFLRQHR